MGNYRSTLYVPFKKFSQLRSQDRVDQDHRLNVLEHNPFCLIADLLDKPLAERKIKGQIRALIRRLKTRDQFFFQ
ncbi:MAG: hypothetical protein A4E63_02275 [Syntrophorhabdus sp. PtaU1.Bin050]|nr:MAG: hypothetical protein A4E63_02275 [Syntrophorhabdus sp. PtaU1.Bin050]